MTSLMRFVVTVVAAVGVVIVGVDAARAKEVKAPIAAGGKTGPVYTVERPLPGAHVESVLTDPLGAVTGAKREPGWLLHHGTERDNCARADATSGLRMICVAW
jgi:hypothetical protein